ncbi:MAG: indole-3-glycerol phosphate synthase TrpC [Bacteroidetes bacterium]|nr:indole-3-glycerol phosphate synthase TrpC [Bacteroidota bacterium]
MNILEKIVLEKRKQVNEEKQLFPTQLLEKSIHFSSKCVSMKKYLLREDKNGIIAEIKKKSPAKGLLHPNCNVEKLSIGYMQAGASALSVLTDKNFFGGSNADLAIARKFNYCPILRKDFVIDEYQIIEAKSIGADTILLIASILSKEEIASFTLLAQQLGMEVILEIHNESELEKICPNLNIIGVNNRNLETMSIDVSTSIQLANKIPREFLKISESGIESAETISTLKSFGYKGFLIGSHFMRHPQPQIACVELISEITKLKIKDYAA